MYHYVQYRPDKKESWHFIDEKQVANGDRRPAFQSVLKVDKDVEAVEERGEDPLDVVKYRGPMYFDLDCEDDLDAVLESSRELVDKLMTKFDIPADYIHCWLSGGKGVHITIPEQLFGVNKSTLHLPVIYKQIAKEVHVEYLDMGVYSAGKGRLWRCEHVARPGSGTFKVGVTVQELEDMDADQYEVMVANARPTIERRYPEKNVSYPKAVLAFKRARQAAKKIINSIKNAKVIPNEEIRKLGETPGCIEKLIKQGDCPDSNWNQAAMQVAAWIAARYDKEQEAEYLADVIDPFVVNVESSSRSSQQERRKHLKDQLNRAFSGKTKFQVGPLIATIGEPCHACPLCRGDLTIEDSKPDAGEQFDKQHKIKATAGGYYHVTEDRSRQLTSFTFRPEYEVKHLDESSTGGLRETERKALVGTLVDDEGTSFYDVEIPESAWNSRTALANAVQGYGMCRVLCADADIAKLSICILRFANAAHDGETEVMTQTKICGIHFDRTSKGKLRPSYIEAGSSIYAGMGTEPFPARFRYNGVHNLSPKLIEEDYPYANDAKLEEALDCLLKVNDDANVARIAGWFAACHLREHIHMAIPQFPLLNVWGNAGAGKTMTALLFCHLNGMDYQQQAEPLNMENATLYPLRDFVTSSTTVPRLIEEVNEGLMHKNNYQRVMAMFKAAWNRSTAARGKLGNRGAEVDNSRVSSPIVYVSEQRTDRASLRNRTIEVMLTAAGREPKHRSDAFKRAYALRYHLFRAAKAMLHRALTLSPEDIPAMLDANDHLVPEGMDERPRFSLLVVMMGLDFMADALEACKIDIRSRIDELKQALSEWLGENFAQLEAEKRTSEVDMVLIALDEMAAEPDDKALGLRPEDHYQRIGSQLSLNLALIMPRYNRRSKAFGTFSQISNAGTMKQLLEGETYFDRLQNDPERTGVKWHVINLDKLAEKGIALPNFVETFDA